MATMHKWLSALCGIGVLVAALACTGSSFAAADCPTGDCVAYELSTQAQCSEETEAATRDGRWVEGLNTNVAQRVKGGQIVAYQILWSTGSWSSWYVPGVNDIDWKYNPHNNTMRRAWSYFYDHTHRYIICK